MAMAWDRSSVLVGWIIVALFYYFDTKIKVMSTMLFNSSPRKQFSTKFWVEKALTLSWGMVFAAGTPDLPGGRKPLIYGRREKKSRFFKNKF